jgi:hypothetical protein
MWKNFVERGRTEIAIWRMRIGCWIPKVTNTHTQYVTPIVFPLQQRLHERNTMLCYVMLCYVVLCCVMLCCVVMCYVMLLVCYVMLCCVVLCFVVFCCVVLCCVLLCCVLLCFVVLCCVVFCCVVFCCVVLCPLTGRGDSSDGAVATVVTVCLFTGKT